MTSSDPATSGSTLREVKLRLANGRRINLTEVWNTSLGGVFVEMNPPLPFGSELELEFVIARGGNVRCEGFVVWSTSTSPGKGGQLDGISVRLASIEISDMRRLAAAVGRYLEA